VPVARQYVEQEEKRLKSEAELKAQQARKVRGGALLLLL
jgi:hypothetical protein